MDILFLVLGLHRIRLELHQRAVVFALAVLLAFVVLLFPRPSEASPLLCRSHKVLAEVDNFVRFAAGNHALVLLHSHPDILHHTLAHNHYGNHRTRSHPAHTDRIVVGGIVAEAVGCSLVEGLEGELDVALRSHCTVSPAVGSESVRMPWCLI